MQLQLSLRVADQLHETLLVRGEPLDAAEAARLLVSSGAVSAPLCRGILAALVSQDRRFHWDQSDTGLLSLRSWELPDPDLAEVAFVALDLETTGARPGASKITEVGAVRIEGLREVGQFSTLVNPLRPIPPMITQITGITQEMVTDAPRIEEVVPALLEFLEGAVIVAHNASFDVGFLNYELQRLNGTKLGEGALDTLPLARALAPGLFNYKLHTVAEALGAPDVDYHRALGDARATAHVFIQLAGRLQERGVTRLGEARAFVSPSSRPTLEKLCLTRDLPRAPGTYRFVDKDGQILYVGKADRLGERVRSYFVASAALSRKVRSAVRLVERIEWDETCTPLEAVVREQELILEHRPTCNLHGTRPETYAYIKAGGPGRGLALFASSRPPKWLAAGEGREPPGGGSLIIGPFRKRSRLVAALDLLQRCYPIRRCPQHSNGRPCVRGEAGHCLAPCADDPRVRRQHDALVIDLVSWLAGDSPPDRPDPVERAHEVMRDLSKQKRYEEAQHLQEACEHLLSVRRSYCALSEARDLSFAALWPQSDNGDGPAVRLNLVWNGRLQKPVTLCPATLEQDIGATLASLWSQPPAGRPSKGASAWAAVPQRELDTLLAVRRWFLEATHAPTVVIPPRVSDQTARQAVVTRLVEEARAVFSAI
jgi:DNA polymerase-3 subunit epsilon